MTELQKKPSPVTPPDQKAPKLWPLYLGLVIVLIFVLVLSALGWFYSNQKNAALNQSLDTQSQDIQRLERSFGKTVDALSETQEALSRTQAALTALDKQALFNNQQLNALHASTRSDWLMAEAEYLMRLANQRLGIEGDVKGAEAILMSADKVLAEIEDPGLLPVRVKLAEEMLALQTINRLDRDGIYAQLEAIIDNLDRLPVESFLGREERQSAEPMSSSDDSPDTSAEDSWRALASRVWKDLSKVFVIRRLDHPVEPLLAPEQQHYLKHNLRLMLEQASFAALDQQQPAFEHSLDKAIRWINNYFVAKNSAIESLKSSLTSLKNRRVVQELPDISGSLLLLKKRIEAMYRQHRMTTDEVSPANGESATSNEKPELNIPESGS